MSSDGDGDGGDGDDYDSVDLLPEYFLDHALGVLGIKLKDDLRRGKKNRVWLWIWHKLERSNCFAKLLDFKRLLIVPLICGLSRCKQCGPKGYFSIESSDVKVC